MIIKNRFWFHYASAHNFYRLAGKLIPWFATVAAITCVVGLWIGFFVAPTDEQQGQVYRIIFIHVPAAWMSMIIYLAMAFWSALGLIFNTRLSFLMSRSLAPTGAMFCVVALVSGALWGKPTWGAYWVWDARLSSQLLLLFLYFGYMALSNAINNPARADKAGAVIALVGAINVPIIYMSVAWWNTLHQGASVSLTKAPSMAAIMLTAMLIMTVSSWSYAMAISLLRVRTLILEREQYSAWINNAMGVLDPKKTGDNI